MSEPMTATEPEPTRHREQCPSCLGTRISGGQFCQMCKGTGTVVVDTEQSE